MLQEHFIIKDYAFAHSDFCFEYANNPYRKGSNIRVCDHENQLESYYGDAHMNGSHLVEAGLNIVADWVLKAWEEQDASM